VPASPSVQPGFFQSLIEPLPFEDGDYPLATVPRQVFSIAAYGNLTYARRRRMQSNTSCLWGRRRASGGSHVDVPGSGV